MGQEGEGGVRADRALRAEAGGARELQGERRAQGRRHTRLGPRELSGFSKGPGDGGSQEGALKGRAPVLHLHREGGVRLPEGLLGGEDEIRREADTGIPRRKVEGHEEVLHKDDEHQRHHQGGDEEGRISLEALRPQVLLRHPADAGGVEGAHNKGLPAVLHGAQGGHREQVHDEQVQAPA